VEEANIYDLTAREGALVGSPHCELLVEVLNAISEKKLQARFDGKPLPPGPWFTLDYLVRQAISALERNPNFFVGWFRSIMVNPSDYRQWREQISRDHDAQRAPRTTRRPNTSRVTQAMKEYIAEEHAKGCRASQKRAWKWAKVMIPGARYQQVVDAMSEAEGGRKHRGRPLSRNGARKSAKS
jgi:hypothetical protein